ITAVEGGASVIMIERGETGGTCVNTGCVPSKALLAAAAARPSAATEPFPGIVTQAGPADMAALTRGKDDLVAGMRAEKYTGLAADYGWRIIAGTARFAGTTDDLRVEVSLNEGGSTTVEARHHLVATGSAPLIPPIPGLDEAGYLTSTTAMELTGLPESLVVIGGNAVGLELGQLFTRLGTQVTIVEALDRLAPFDEPEISAAIEDVLGDEGTGVVTGATVTGVRRNDRSRSVALRTAAGEERELACGQVLLAAGRRPVTAGLNLAAVGVRAGGRGEIVPDIRQQTGNPRIWAAGDVTGGPPYVYTAAAQGSAAAANALFHAEREVDYTALPRVTFASPAIASAGLTEAELVRSGVACDCRVLPLGAVPRAIVNRDARGVVKLVVEAATGRVRGVHAVADGAGEMITAGVYAIRSGMTVQDLAGTWAPYLTVSEALRLAAQSFSRDQAVVLRGLTAAPAERREPMMTSSEETGWLGTASRQAALTAPQRDLHRAVLRRFLETGTAPTLDWVRQTADGLGLGDPAVTRLEAADLVHFSGGMVAVAYPFSGRPTRQQVELDGFPAVYAMCAIDALGVPAMTGTDGRIAAVDPRDGAPVVVSVRGGQWRWTPAGAAVVYGHTAGCGTGCGSWEVMCPHTTFHASRDSAQAYLAARDGIEGEILSQEAAVKLGERIFGPLLGGHSDRGHRPGPC
ncbi:MAG: mercury(II) reductase, partial [Streptosporangiaceae bacterium]